MSRLVLRRTLSVLLLALSGSVQALGLGEMHGQPNLGERLRLEIDLLGELGAGVDSTCFQLTRPSGKEDLPWLKNATLSVRRGTPPVLQIRSEIPLREPIFQIAVRLGCGHEVAREYLLLASPASASLPPVTAGAETVPSAPTTERRSASARQPRMEMSIRPLSRELRPSEKPLLAAGAQKRILLSHDVGDAEPSLRLATEVQFANGEGQVTEAQRALLRLEFRMLLAISEQAATQLETAEKLRTMESMLGDLQQRATEFAQRAETSAKSPLPAAEPAPAVVAPASLEAKPAFGEWSLYGLLLGGLLGLAAWFGWQRHAGRARPQEESQLPAPVPELQVAPKREQEREELGEVDLAVESAAMGVPMQVDFELETHHEVFRPDVEPEMLATPINSVFSTAATTQDECCEANPVMELADIMLSFGRVKGAAQALQEYIDNNPQEALQPWMRLMDVYRMAGMRAEFEEVSRNLNQNFNVEIQRWDTDRVADDKASFTLLAEERSASLPTVPRPESLEELPRLMEAVCSQWATGDVVGYLYQLLRDNRGGQRTGFALAIVEDILFLIELKETSNRMERESAAS